MIIEKEESKIFNTLDGISTSTISNSNEQNKTLKYNAKNKSLNFSISEEEKENFNKLILIYKITLNIRKSLFMYKRFFCHTNS